ncbi:hypothetical protein LWI28_009949 [Acer negundo]|uniref:Uncharacterized protein n=1 Tax=Acer negundo TaxID=4023 RepID=A0AAD5J8P6_ACENE|nr:hypothetical protein LWI28_009949 [Acer negundo]
MSICSGLAGIVHVLMDMELKPDEVEDVKGKLRYMIKNRFPGGNYSSSEGIESDRLVHRCHGAPGITLTLVKAAQERWYGKGVSLSELASVMASACFSGTVPTDW